MVSFLCSVIGDKSLLFLKYSDDFIGKKCPKDNPTVGKEILENFQKACEDATYYKVISKLQFALKNVKRDHTVNIKARWEAEGHFTITLGEQDGIC